VITNPKEARLFAKISHNCVRLYQQLKDLQSEIQKTEKIVQQNDLKLQQQNIPNIQIPESDIPEDIDCVRPNGTRYTYCSNPIFPGQPSYAGPISHFMSQPNIGDTLSWYNKISIILRFYNVSPLETVYASIINGHVSLVATNYNNTIVWQYEGVGRTKANSIFLGNGFQSVAGLITTFSKRYVRHDTSVSQLEQTFKMLR